MRVEGIFYQKVVQSSGSAFATAASATCAGASFLVTMGVGLVLAGLGREAAGAGADALRIATGAGAGEGAALTTLGEARCVCGMLLLPASLNTDTDCTNWLACVFRLSGHFRAGLFPLGQFIGLRHTHQVLLIRHTIPHRTGK